MHIDPDIQKLFDEQKFTDAKILIDALPKPNSIVLTGWWLLYQSRLIELSVLVDSASAEYPQNIEFVILSALLADEQGEELRAFELYASVLEHGWHKLAFFNVMFVYISTAQFENAESLMGSSEEYLTSMDLSEWEWRQIKLYKAQMARHLGNPREAIQLLMSLTTFDVDAYLLLGHTYRDEHLLTEALLAYQEGLQLDPNNLILQHSVETILQLIQSKGDVPKPVMGPNPIEMRRYLERTLAMLLAKDEMDPESIHLKNALMNRQTSQPPDGYVEELFDDYAERFDVHLLEQLQYQVPDLVGSIVNRHLTKAAVARVLDLGCGTGLVADKLNHHHIKQLVGVDISQKMLNKAAIRGVYHELLKKDIRDYLEHCPMFDIIIIADTLVYLGDLSTMFSLVESKLADNGIAIFTIESSEQTGIRGYHLQHTGRYSHSQLYLENLLDSAGFHNVHIANVLLRQGSGTWVDGQLYVVSR